ncbi:hypothetical protein F2Q68_00015314 [Brassica cretica]|uniref:Uncharacterized protein n=1 Tax=Brassica cretica TaxID=69181 RepID=A0A8S9HIC7_BRACR|nr:hypothetical protein F2Q68_00015314 [Brassica cretica]
MTPTESTTSCNVVRTLTHEEFAERHPHPPSPVFQNRSRFIYCSRSTKRERHRSTTSSAIDRRAPLTYRIHMPKIDVARLNAVRPQPKPSDNPPEATSTHSDDAKEIGFLWEEP